jgi:phospholipase C
MVPADATQAAQPVRHVFVLMLENRSFDHFLGFSQLTGTDAETGRPTAVTGLSGLESNTCNGVPFRVTPQADQTMPLDPGHEFTDVLTQLCGPAAVYRPGGPYPEVTNTGFVDSYVKSGGASNPGEIMKCFGPGQLPVLTALAREFAVCDGWRASMPGPTWPNRFFMMAASSGGLDHSPDFAQITEWLTVDGFGFEHGNLFQALSSAHKSWRVYHGDQGPLAGSFPIAGGLKGVMPWDPHPYSKFASDVAAASYPAQFTLIEPNYGDVAADTYRGGQSQHPLDDVRAGEALIKSAYEALRASPLWDTSLLIVTWDEHGGFYDHAGALPGGAPAPGDKVVTPGDVNKFGFTFEQYGPRVPAVVVSPRIPPNLIDHRSYDHASIPATVEKIFTIPPLTQRDRHALDVTSLLSLPGPRPAPATLPAPAATPATTPVLAQLAGKAGDAAPVDDGTLPGFLHIAQRYDLATSPPEQAPAIHARVASISTRGGARQYMEEVATRVAATAAAKAAQNPETGGQDAQLG